MIKILAHNHIDRAVWGWFIRENRTGTWFQSPEAYDFFASMPELFAPFVVAISDERLGIRGICVGYVTVEKNAIKQFLTRRAIILGGPALADDCTEEEVEALMRAVVDGVKCKVYDPIYIETRNFNDYSKWRRAFEKAGFDYQPHLNFHVDTTSMEIVEANLGKNKKRDIRTSFRDGAFIIEQPTIEQVREYYKILMTLYRTKVKTPLFPLSFFEALWHHPDGRYLLVGMHNANGETEIIGGSTCVELAGKCVYDWFACGRDGESKSIFPSSVSTYAAIRYAAEHGCPRFDMMGAGTPNEAYGVRDFKARFGGKEVEHGRFLFVTKPLLYRIGKLGVFLLKKLK